MIILTYEYNKYIHNNIFKNISNTVDILAYRIDEKTISFLKKSFSNINQIYIFDNVLGENIEVIDYYSGKYSNPINKIVKFENIKSNGSFYIDDKTPFTWLNYFNDVENKNSLTFWYTCQKYKVPLIEKGE
jgi:hypothetical protein